MTTTPYSDLSDLPVTRISAGDFLFREGERAPVVYLVKGAVRVERGPVVLDLLRAPCFVLDPGVLDGLPSGSSATTLRASQAILSETIDRPILERAVHELLRARVEAHGLLAWDQGIHGNVGVGAGARVSFAISQGNRIGNFSDELAFTLGAAYLHFECPYGKDCADAHTLYVPIALAWSFALHENVSVFVEPAIAAFISAFREACPMGVTCAPYDHFGLRPVVDLGIAAHLGPVHVVFRAGFPTFSLGLGL